MSLEKIREKKLEKFLKKCLLKLLTYLNNNIIFIFHSIILNLNPIFVHLLFINHKSKLMIQYLLVNKINLKAQ